MVLKVKQVVLFMPVKKFKSMMKPDYSVPKCDCLIFKSKE